MAFLLIRHPPESWNGPPTVESENPDSVLPPNWVKVCSLVAHSPTFSPSPTLATANPDRESILLPNEPSDPLSFIASTFSHACPSRMYSDLGTFLQGPVSGKEKKRRTDAQLVCMRFFPLPNPIHEAQTGKMWHFFHPWT